MSPDEPVETRADPGGHDAGGHDPDGLDLARALTRATAKSTLSRPTAPWRASAAPTAAACRPSSAAYAGSAGKRQPM